MEQKQVTPFEELHAMLLFGTETPMNTVGEVQQHLEDAHMSRGIARINNTIAHKGLARLIGDIEQAAGTDDSDALFLNGLARHLHQLMELEDMAIARDIVVMESWLVFMDAAAGTDNRSGDIPF